MTQKESNKVSEPIPDYSKNPLAISVKNLHKSFKLPVEKSFGLKQAFFNRLRGIKGYKKQKVLKFVAQTQHFYSNL